MKAIERVKEFVRQYRMQNGVDPEIIKMIHVDPDPSSEMARLRSSDLDYLVAYASRTHVVLVIHGNSQKAYGPFSQMKAERVRADLEDDAKAGLRPAALVLVKKLIDTERKNLERKEHEEEKRSGW